MFSKLKKHLIVCLSVLVSETVFSEAHESSIKKQSWSFNKFFGTFRKEELQRGFQVYKEVCSACHGLKHVAFRNLESLGFNENEIKALAAMVEVTDGPDDEGKMFQRPGLPKDYLLSPYSNDKIARASNNGALPPDLSLITKARLLGADYVYALLTGYQTAPQHLVVEPGKYYNTAYPGHLIAMPAPLHDFQITYHDGTKSTVEQMAKDVVSFLSWAAEPELEQRKQTGLKVILYLLVMTLVFYRLKKKIWSKIH